MGYTDKNGRYTQTEQKIVRLPLNNFWLAAGTPLAAFADAAAVTPGLALNDSEAAGVRWNNHATPAAMFTTLPIPGDRRPNTAIVVKALVSKSGATAGDVTTLTIGAFFQTVGALSDADADAGGASNAVTAAATAKTVQLVQVSIAAADVPDAPANLTLAVKPTAGTLGTDDLTIHAIWLEYERIVTPT
jgi:hypothetical protein